MTLLIKIERKICTKISNNYNKEKKKVKIWKIVVLYNVIKSLQWSAYVNYFVPLVSRDGKVFYTFLKGSCIHLVIKEKIMQLFE